jgi:serine/threonine protein kinase
LGPSDAAPPPDGSESSSGGAAGHGQDGGSPAEVPAWASAPDVLEAVREATAGKYELLSPAIAEGPDTVRFRSRVVATGETVALRLTRQGAEGVQTEFALFIDPQPASDRAVLADVNPASSDPAFAPTRIGGFATAVDHPRIAGVGVPGGAAAAPTIAPVAQRVDEIASPTGRLTCPTCGTTYPPETKFCARDGAALLGERLGAVAVGQVIADRYRVVRKLGEGGMGEVYLCEHVLMGSPVAIKILRPALVSDADALSRFLREARNASRVVHPHVARIYDVGEMPGHLAYLAMEYIDGPTLAAVLKQDGAMPINRVADIVAQVTDAISVAHGLGIVHRDLKPDNLMLARARDGRDDVKVVDFGVAKAFGAHEQLVTASGFIVGTPAYMSPEQLAGETLDGRSDLYSLAIIAFMMLTGSLPFIGDTPEQVMMARLTAELRGLGTVRPDVRWPPSLQMVLDRGLAKSPDDRYATIEEFGRAFDAAARSTDYRVSGRAQDAVGAAPRFVPREPDASDQRLETRGQTESVTLPVRSRRWSRLRATVAVVLVAIGVGAVTIAVRNYMSTGDGTNSTGDRTTSPISSATGRTDSVPVPPTPRRKPLASASLTPETRRAALAKLAQESDPRTATTASARQVLSAVTRLLPYLVTRDDSVEALYRAVEARATLNDSAGTCSALRALQPKATDTKFAPAVGALATGMNCGGA